MNSKRGSLPVDELVKFFLGAIVLIAIIAILVIFFNIVSGTLHKQQAKTNLDNIAFEAEKMTDGQTREILIESPKDWVIMARGTEICFCSPISDLYSSSVTVNPVLQNKVFDICKTQNICKSIDREISISTSCANSWGSIANCLQITKVPYGLQVDKGSSIVKLFPSSLGGAPRTVYGSQNPSCSFSGDSVYYDQTLILSGGKVLVQNINLGFKDCKLELLKDSVVRFNFKCSDYPLEKAVYLPFDSSLSNCNVLSIQDSNANFSCFLNKEILKGKDSTKCDLEVIVEWVTVDCSKTYLEGGGSRCPIQNWSELVFNLPKDSFQKDCSIEEIKYTGYRADTGSFNFSFKSNCSNVDFANFIKRARANSEYKIESIEEGNLINTYDWGVIDADNIIQESYDSVSKTYLNTVSLVSLSSTPSIGNFMDFYYSYGKTEVRLK